VINEIRLRSQSKKIQLTTAPRGEILLRNVIFGVSQSIMPKYLPRDHNQRLPAKSDPIWMR
jgi:hypothetical protein